MSGQAHETSPSRPGRGGAAGGPAGWRPGLRGGLALALLLLLTGACTGLEKGGLFPADRNRVFVGYFDNKTFYRDVEFLITEAVVEEILSRPGLHLTSREEADVILSGRVVKVQQNVLSEDPSRTVTSQSTTVTVVVDVIDARTGDVLSSRRLTQRGEFVPNLGEDLADARREAYRFLARDVVRELELEF
jgi:hypothetical protein